MGLSMLLLLTVLACLAAAGVFFRKGAGASLADSHAHASHHRVDDEQESDPLSDWHDSDHHQ